MKILKQKIIPNIVDFISTVFFLYSLYLLIFSMNKGFDITDESFYILNAKYVKELNYVITHHSYYSQFLFWILNDNLLFVRIVGILILLISTLFLSIELCKYVHFKYDFSLTKRSYLKFALPSLIGGLVYYMNFLRTISYNWFALVSVILTNLFLFRIVNNKTKNYEKIICLDYILLSASLTLSFMAKPTTAIFLAIIVGVFFCYEYKNINFKKSIPPIILTTTLFVILHIVLLDGGFKLYFEKLFSGLNKMAIIGGGHTLSSRTIDLFDKIYQYAYKEIFNYYIENLFILLTFIILNLSNLVFKKIECLKKYSKQFIEISLFLVLLCLGLIILEYNLLIDSNLVWIKSVKFLIVEILFFFFLFPFFKKKKLIIIITILVSHSFAYSFGTGNDIIKAMSKSLIFIVLAITTFNYIIDKHLKTNIFMPLSTLILSIWCSFVIYEGSENPYRLKTSIQEQDQYVNLLGGLYVDELQKKYILDLQKSKKDYSLGAKNIKLIDMTGGSPGVNIILKMGVFDSQWLFGGYSGSNEFALECLKKYKRSESLRNAWILIAPSGKIKIDLKVLKQVELNFPKDYFKVCVIMPAHRDEEQELWIPKTNQKVSTLIDKSKKEIDNAIELFQLGELEESIAKCEKVLQDAPGILFELTEIQKSHLKKIIEAKIEKSLLFDLRNSQCSKKNGINELSYHKTELNTDFESKGLIINDKNIYTLPQNSINLEEGTLLIELKFSENNLKNVYSTILHIPNKKLYIFRWKNAIVWFHNQNKIGGENIIKGSNSISLLFSWSKTKQSCYIDGHYQFGNNYTTKQNLDKKPVLLGNYDFKNNKSFDGEILNIKIFSKSFLSKIFEIRNSNDIKR